MLAPWFAVAGLIAAAAVVVIHLLNRRRYRVIAWAAMDFLREAIHRNRRILQLRDLLLLALRTGCLILFGLALARPFWGRSEEQVDPNQPVHAVILVDNSLSMAYRELDKSVLDLAKAKAKQQIDSLPRGSRISVLPTCGLPSGFSYEAYYGTDEALEALESIQPVDRATTARETVDLALEACRRVPDMTNKRILLLTDTQVASWPAESLAPHLKQLPKGIEVEEIVPQEVENAWIADLKLRDGVADLQTPAVFVATVQYAANRSVLPRRDVPVTLTVDGVQVATKTVELQPGQKREVEFPPYQFDVMTEPGKPTFVRAEVSIPGDRLPDDDQRFLVVPVVATLPVVFVDQWGEGEEDPRRNRYGETFHLRRLLAPMASRAERIRQLVAVRHVTIDQLQGVEGRNLLADARLVVVAGVASPEQSGPLLREYVEQGGNLVIAAGGQFDAAPWTAAAWNNGLGVLPAPLEPVAVGSLPEDTQGQFEPFQLDYNSLQNHEYFLVEGVSREEQDDLYCLPYFFKTCVAKVDDEVKQAAVTAVAGELNQRRRDLAELDRQLDELAQRESQHKLTPEELNRRANLQRQRQQLEPSWLLWSPRDEGQNGQESVDALADRSKPQVLARYTSGLPFMVERRLGRGRVLLVTTGVFPRWNTLAFTNAMLIYDRILRRMLEGTLPERNLGTERPVELPVAASERIASFWLTEPDGQQRQVEVAAGGADRWVLPLGDLVRRGHYQLTATRKENLPQDAAAPRGGLENRIWTVWLAVDGPAEESQLLPSDEARSREDRGRTDALEAAGPFDVEGLQRAHLKGTGLWWWLLAAVLACLLVEMTVLAWPSLGREKTA
jgi:hypothetical protein